MTEDFEFLYSCRQSVAVRIAIGAVIRLTERRHKTRVQILYIEKLKPRRSAN